MSVREVQSAPPLPAGLAACFGHADQRVAATLKALRELVFETAADTPGVGELAETLKWGQPSYTPKRPRTGSSVRIATNGEGRPALFFICHTNLVDRFREIYADTLTFEGNRALVFDPGETLPEAELKHCIAMALTYKLKR